MGSIANPLLEERLDEVGVDEKRALIQRIAASENFARSARLRDFLLYVGMQSLKPGCPEIHEQEIGAKVFGRSSSYDRSQDNIVRVNASELRKRIEQYYATKGIDETLILEIPRGGYMPVFRRRVLAPIEPAPPPVVTEPVVAASQPLASPGRPAPWRNQAIWGGVCVALALACAMLWQQNRSMRRAMNPWEGKPAVAMLWRDFLRPSQQTDIVLADAALSISEELTRRPISLPDYINYKYVNDAGSSSFGNERREDLTDIYGHNLVAFGDLRAAQEIVALSPVGSSLRLTHSRFFQAESAKRDNFVLIGGKKANPWIYLFDDQMAFSLDYDETQGLGYVVNRHPRPGEEASYTASRYPNGFVGYSVVAYLPNPSHSGKVIILTGTDSDATSAAAEFLTSEEQLEKFQSTLKIQQFPYFEVLLKTSRLSGTSFNAEVVAYRTLPTPR